MRLIDTEQLEYKDFITPIRDKDGMVYPLHRLGVTKEDIKNAPTIDAVPVKHGEWIVKGQDIFCSVCGEESAYTWSGASKFSNYCPNCGAKMDGGKDETD